MITESPALIGIPRRSRNNPSAIQATVDRACMAAVGIDVPMPVFHDNRPVAVLRGVPDRRHVEVTWCAFNSYADIKSAIASGRLFTTFIHKSQNLASTVANNWYDFWPINYNPSPGAYPGAANIATPWSEGSVGAIPHGGNVSPYQKNLMRVDMSAGIGGSHVLILYDRVLTYEASPISTLNQVFTNALPATRYVSAGEPGLKVMVTAQTTLGVTASAFTQLRYTDQDGNTLQSMPVSFGTNVIVSATAPTTALGARVVSPSILGATQSIGPFMPLASGDTGVRLINDVTFSANNTGTLAYVLCQPIAYLNVMSGTISVIEYVMQMTSLPVVKDGACLSLLSYVPAASNFLPQGRIDFAWG
jgi:hypothetical protein